MVPIVGTNLSYFHQPRNRLINARGETLAEKPSFRAAYKYRRCLIPADGFYEGKRQPGTKAKTPYLIYLKSRQPFVFAGLWETWHSPDGSQIKSCTIITTQPNEFLATIHNRMPVILPPDAYAQWLDAGIGNPAELQPLLAPYPVEEMAAYPVSTLVNNPKDDRAECIVPAQSSPQRPLYYSAMFKDPLWRVTARERSLRPKGLRRFAAGFPSTRLTSSRCPYGRAGFAHLHCTTPALAGGARERSAVQVSLMMT